MPEPDLDVDGATPDDTRPLSPATVALPASGPSLLVRRGVWPPVLDVFDVTDVSGDAAVDLTTVNFLGFSAWWEVLYGFCWKFTSPSSSESIFENPLRTDKVITMS